MRLRLLAGAGVVLLAIVGAFAVLALRGGDAPAPPALSTAPADEAAESSAPAQAAWEVVAGGQTFVGYRVREEFATIGVTNAVGRTDEVTGTVDVASGSIRAARLEADLTSLTSDEARRDAALRDRGIETSRFPRASFELTAPVTLSREATSATGDLTLHGKTRPIEVSMRGQRIGTDAIEVVGSGTIAFDEFGIDPPSVAGLVTVQDQGKLEFRLRLRPG